ncbi:MAG TPA: ABC transporter permease [Vicinamibacterales bacterium]|jgi:putative ABC transport system permease protein|nr:ABC transporter permease [Vicinamibacterales bacterium]
MAVIQDLRYGLRALIRTPSVTAVAILTLTIGIGANTAAFSVIDAVLLRPLPFADAARLMRVHERRESDYGHVSGHEFAAWRDRNGTFDGLVAYEFGGANLTGAGDPQALQTLLVSARFFDVLGMHAIMGRGFVVGEDQRGANHVAVLSHRLWQRSFGSNPAIVGAVIRLDNEPYSVVGVMPPASDLDPDLWVPMDLPQELRRVGRHSLNVIGRLKPDKTPSEARADLAVISRNLEREMPDMNTGHGVEVVPLYDDIVGDARRPVLVAFGAVAFVLLIACANVAHLLLTRAAAREREVAVRTALGATRGDLIRQFLVESLLLACAGGALGVLLAAWIVDLLPAIKAIEIPRLADTRIDLRVLGVSTFLTCLTGVLCGILPALRSTAPQLQTRLNDGGRQQSPPGVGRLASALVVSEVALALMLLIGASLLTQSLIRLVRVEPGFTARDVLVIPVALPGQRYPQPQQRIAAFEDLIGRIRALPGVRAAGATTHLPLAGADNRTAYSIVGSPPPPAGQAPVASIHEVSADYFTAMKIPLVRGRFFSANDARVALPLIRWFEQQPPPPRYDESQPLPVAVVSETMARQSWPGQDPIGRQVQILFSPPITVVGVVGDVRHRGLRLAAPAEIYLPHVQEPQWLMTLVVSIAGDPAGLAAAVREQIRSVDRDLPVAQMQPMEDVLRDSIGGQRFDAFLLGTIGVVGVALALLGIYGVMSYSVARRTREIGIRTALGARTRDVLALVLGRAMNLTALGLALGLAGSFALTRLLETLLFEITPTDVMTFTVVSMLLGAVALGAGYLPARRALRVDPSVALRPE